MAEEIDLRGSREPNTSPNHEQEYCINDYIPDQIFLHILSLLDTKSLVRTSLVCKRWQSLWKETPALNFRCPARGQPSYRHHVIKLILSLYSGRLTPAVPSTAIFDFSIDAVTRWDSRLFGFVMRYYHDAGGRSGGLQDLSIFPGLLREKFAAIGGSIGGQKKSLRTLRLARSLFQGPDGFSGFSSLTTLELTDCSFYGSIANPGRKSYTGSAIVLPFGDVPSLRCLKLIDCWSEGRVIVSVPQVLDLEIRNRDFLCFRIDELLAPKVKSFRFSGHVRDLRDCGGEGCFGGCYCRLPSLDDASIRLVWAVDRAKMDRAFLSLFRGMHNAKSIDL